LAKWLNSLTNGEAGERKERYLTHDVHVENTGVPKYEKVFE